MPRPPKLRQVTAMPAVTLFKPAGLPMAGMRMVTLAVEELEAMRLKDIEDLHQEECATRMGISRATFHQVLKSARGKLTDAIMNGKAIQVEGGSFALPGGRFRCRRDGSEWTLPPGPLPGLASVSCPTCRGREVHPVPDSPAESPDLRAGGRGRGWQGPWGRPAGGPRWNGRRGQVRHMQVAGGHPIETPRATGPARPGTSDDAHIAPGSGAQQDNR
ncbi:MAG: DUF134 domain-containing protein [Dehalococcoidia bacterium]|nr:DUF134 domain-containing protein [Dehalococcoidia bacterium]